MIRGEKINLRLVEERDLETWHKLQSEVKEKGLYSDPTIRGIVHLKKKYQEHGFTKYDFGIFLITDKEDKILGMIQHFKGPRYNTGYELGAVVYKEEDRKKGFMTEAISLYTAYLFETQPIPRLELCTSVENIGAQRVAEKAGFTYEGINRKACYFRGIATDVKRYSILREEVKNLKELI